MMGDMVGTGYEMLTDLAQRGGWVMWPLGVMSVVALTLIFERCWFFLVTNNRWRQAKFVRISRHLRHDEHDQVAALVAEDRSVYGRLVQRLIAEGPDAAAADEAITLQRPRLERFMPTLGTIITAAPMLGILGTVTGIISAFRILSDEAVTDPSMVGMGIAEALLTTVVGLVIALVVLFPFNAFRAQVDRSLGRMESLVASAQHSQRRRERASATSQSEQAEAVGR
ncbi:MAG: MotA/TolQ/ExbB proton channel family protein [Phycisphaeraceae bacterium]